MTQSHIPLKKGLDPLAQRFKWIPQFMVNMSGESINRDECRTPMQWNTEQNSGFTKAVPWLPINNNYTETNVKASLANENSLLNFYKNMLKYRSNTSAFQTGKLAIDHARSNKKIFAYYRIAENEKYLILLNMSKKTIEVKDTAGEVILSTHSETPKTTMRPHEGRIVKISE
jgi:oligo-1,6-glucosidase/alpha-glucosidase